LTELILPVAGAALVASLALARLTGGERAFAAFTVQAKPAAHSASPEEPITPTKLERHVQCMRDHGFDLPEPVRTADGWRIPVDRPPVPVDPKLSPKRWREAFSVDCRLLDAEENLVLGGRTRAEIDSLLSCTQARGFSLPEPADAGQGEFVFDLARTSPPWGSEAWYRVVFVTCAPADAGP